MYFRHRPVLTPPGAGIKGLRHHYLASGEGLKEAWGAQNGGEKVLFLSGTAAKVRGVGAACGLLALAGTGLGNSIGIQLWELAFAFPKLVVVLQTF